MLFLDLWKAVTMVDVVEGGEEQEADEQQEKANEWQEADDQQKEADEQPGYINSHWKVDHKGTMVLQRDRKSIY